MAQRSPRRSLFSLVSSSKSGSKSREPKRRNGTRSEPQGQRRDRRESSKSAIQAEGRRQKAETQKEINLPGITKPFDPVVSQLRQRQQDVRDSRKSRRPETNRSRVTDTRRPANSTSPVPLPRPTPTGYIPRSSSSVSDSPVPPKRPVKPTKRRRVSPMVYGARLLILGIGIGVISGTVLSVLNSFMRSSAEANSTVQGSVEGKANSQPTTGVETLPLSLQLTQELLDLKKQILRVAEKSPNVKPAVFFVDTDTGAYLDINGQGSIPAASTIKVPVLVAFFQAVDAGKLHLSDKLTLQQQHIGGGSGVFQDQPIGTEYTALETVTQMITISDNTATNMIIDAVGGAEILNQKFREWGLKETVINNPLPDLEGTNKTSSRDLVNLFAQLNQGGLVSLKSRDLIFRIMEKTESRSLLPRGLGEGAIIAHKTGNIKSVSGDVGLVDMPNGKRYIVSVMVERQDDDPTAEGLIRTISQTIYQYLDESMNPQSDTVETQPQNEDNSTEQEEEQ